MRLRPIKAMAMPAVTPAEVPKWRPKSRVVEPTALVVDEQYQRNLSDRSLRLIRKIVAEWDWSAYKPPIVVETEAGALHVIDGQHTAIAAASHPGIDTIPVFVVQAPDVKNRAAAFVRHNRDRITMTATSLHYALVAAGDDDAVTISQVCERSGVKLLKTQPVDAGAWRVGETTAIGALRALVRRRFAVGAGRVLRVCTQARLAPVTADHIKAVEALLFQPEWENPCEVKIAAALIRMNGQEIMEAAQLAAGKKWPRWRALVVVLARESKRRAVAA